jgi:hypothetical protein
MTALDDLRNEQLSWRASLDLTDIDGHTEATDTPEDLLFRLRTAITVYRYQVLPHLTAEVELVLPALVVELQDEPIAGGYARVLAEELDGVVRRMDAAQRDLLQYPHSEPVRSRVMALLTAAAALATVAMRFGDEVVLPHLSERLGPHHSEQIAEAVQAYEHAYR